MTNHSRSSGFLDRYAEPLPIRSRGAFQLLSAQRDDGKACVLVLPGADADPGLVEQAFAEIERVHGLIDSPIVPKVSRRAVVQGTPLLEFDCPAVVDAEEVICMMADLGVKLGYEAADGFLRSLRIGLEPAHATIDPKTGRPICLGRISRRNLLFDRNGRWYLIGFGRNFPLEREDGQLDGETVFYAAPEVAAGSPPTPMADYVALLLYGRSVTPFIDLLEPLRARPRNDLRMIGPELFKLVTWTEVRVLAAPAALRPTLQEAVQVA